MSAIYRTFSADCASTIEFAMRPDGQWFKRIQSKRLGRYVRGKWRRTTEPDASIVRRGPNAYAGQARLPKGDK